MWFNLGYDEVCVSRHLGVSVRYTLSLVGFPTMSWMDSETLAATYTELLPVFKGDRRIYVYAWGTLSVRGIIVLEPITFLFDEMLFNSP